MTRFSRFLAALFALFLFSWIGLVVVPYIQIGKMQAVVDQESGEAYPVDSGGLIAAGREVYAANGCVTCHTQQVLPGFAGADIARKWGLRQSVARDYLYERPAFLGSARIGPDLSNVGLRRRDAAWHHAHLYDPRSVVRDSIMPSFKHLYEERKLVGQTSMEALKLSERNSAREGYQIVPTSEANALVAYLMALDRSHTVPEAIQEAKPDEPAPATAAEPAAAGVSK